MPLAIPSTKHVLGVLRGQRGKGRDEPSKAPTPAVAPVVEVFDGSATYNTVQDFPVASSKRRESASAAIAPPAWSLPPPSPPTEERKSRFMTFGRRNRANSTSVGRLGSKSPKEDVPTSWKEYAALYSSNRIDIDDPPRPPMREALEAAAGGVPVAPTPFEERVWPAPLPDNELDRQAVVSRLDFFDNHPLPGGRAELRPSLVNDAALCKIVEDCCETFGVKMAFLAVLDDERHLWLASTGAPDGVTELPRSATFCTHAILNGDRGLVVPNALEDWRFEKGILAQALGARFYSGVPLFAPRLGDSSAPPVALGSLCLADLSPRTDFTEAQRAELQAFSAMATSAIERWVASGTGAKVEVEVAVPED